MKTKVFIDGQEGTTGLQLKKRLEAREDIQVLSIQEELRKDPQERKRLMAQAEFTFLCLPDTASIEAVALAQGTGTRLIDASTAHRVNSEWDYGFPELSPEHRRRISLSDRVAVTGCYASGFISLCYPLVQGGILSPQHPVTSYGISGYSGGGKKMIAAYEEESRPKEYDSPRWYALNLAHKHLPEMQQVCGLEYKPLFTPIVDDYYQGMVVCLPLVCRTLAKPMGAREIHAALRRHYEGQHFVQVMPFGGEEILTDGLLASNTLAGTNQMQLFVFGNEEQALLASRLDNLGKGASGAAVQCLNIMMGLDEKTGLE